MINDGDFNNICTVLPFTSHQGIVVEINYFSYFTLGFFNGSVVSPSLLVAKGFFKPWNRIHLGFGCHGSI